MRTKLIGIIILLVFACVGCDTIQWRDIEPEMPSPMILSIKTPFYYGGWNVEITVSVEQVALPVTEYGFCVLVEGEAQETKVCIQSYEQEPTTDFTYTDLLDVLLENKVYKVRAYAKNKCGTYYSEEVQFISIQYQNDVACIDLGLTHLWATANVGASYPLEVGEYFTWGETTFKADYSYANLSWKESQPTELQTNNQLVLQADVAHARYGGNWRVPSQADIDELIQQCKWEWVTLYNMNGYMVTGRTGSSIFLPAVGFKAESGAILQPTMGYYYSTQCKINSWPYVSLYSLCFSKDAYMATWFDAFYAGYVVRAVN